MQTFTYTFSIRKLKWVRIIKLNLWLNCLTLDLPYFLSLLCGQRYFQETKPLNRLHLIVVALLFFQIDGNLSRILVVALIPPDPIIESMNIHFIILLILNRHLAVSLVLFASLPLLVSKVITNKMVNVNSMNSFHFNR